MASAAFRVRVADVIARAALAAESARVHQRPLDRLHPHLHGPHDEASTVSIVDPDNMIEIERVETGIMPHGSRLSNSGLKHYSVAMMSGELFELDAVRMEVTRKLSMENHHKIKHHKNIHHNMPKEKPTWVYPHPNDEYLYVVNNGTDEVVEIDVNKWTVSRRFKTAKKA